MAGKLEQLAKKIAVRLDRPVRQRLKDLGVVGSHFLRQTNTQADVAVVEYDRKFEVPALQKTEKPNRNASVY
jgi:hypothetical protein